VRYETRPQLRKDAHALFRAKRVHMCEEERAKREHGRQTRTADVSTYLEGATAIRSDVAAADEAMRSARRALSASRKHDAAHMRERRKAGEERRASLAGEAELCAKRRHDVVINERFVADGGAFGDGDEADGEEEREEALLSARSSSGRSVHEWKAARSGSRRERSGVARGAPALAFTPWGMHVTPSGGTPRGSRASSVASTPRMTSRHGTTALDKWSSQVGLQVNLLQYL
jgi:hypothetical protein